MENVSKTVQKNVVCLTGKKAKRGIYKKQYYFSETFHQSKKIMETKDIA